MEKDKKLSAPDRVSTYFRKEKLPLLIVTVTGMIYNIGLVAVPFLEGKLTQCLLDILNGKSTFAAMVRLALVYAGTTAVVHTARYFKRFYVRRFANDVNRSMKQIIYGNLVYREKAELERENVGSLMTKAISDVETCAEGMRKFTTEVFDTGVAMIGYIGFLLWYDWRLALLCMIFPPVSGMIAEKMKTVVQRSSATYKESSGALSAATLDRVQGAVTYRVFGCEEQRDAAYEECLKDYEKKAVFANLWVSSLQPLYKVLSLVSVLFILYFGGRNVLHTGWAVWDIAAFTAFLNCYTRLANKASHTAKLFNAVHKAQVSWRRIKPLMKTVPEAEDVPVPEVSAVEASGLGFAWPDGGRVFEGLDLNACAGQIIGVTGPVACGKSTFGRTFLCEYPYEGSLRADGKELSAMPREEQKALVGYLGHDPEILSDSIRNNIAMGEDMEAEQQQDRRFGTHPQNAKQRQGIDHWLDLVCLTKEVSEMPDGADTLTGSGGIRLSGGQQQRAALARTLAHKRPILVLDDPFSALDRRTESEIFRNLREMSSDRIIFLISHRLYHFPEMDQVIWMENVKCEASDHETLMRTNETYAGLYLVQAGTADDRIPEFGGDEIVPEPSVSAGNSDGIGHQPSTTVMDSDGIRPKPSTPDMNRGEEAQSIPAGDDRRRGRNPAIHTVLRSMIRMKFLTAAVLLVVTGAVIAALLPPLVLERAVNGLTAGEAASWGLAFCYFGLLALTGILESAREALLTLLGQKITHALRSELCAKLDRLPADTFVKTEPGVTASRFVGDVDTVEELFTSGIISMFADACQMISIFFILFVKNRGLAILLLALMPVIYRFTREVQRRVLEAQKDKRAAVGRVTNHVPETIRCIRMIHSLRAETYMQEKYDRHIEDSYAAMERTNFFDAIYSPVIIVSSAVVVSLIMVLAASGNLHIQSFFGMSAGTAVAVISYIYQVFTPIESIGMEIQTIQSAAAGVHRINEFLLQGERGIPGNDGTVKAEEQDGEPTRTESGKAKPCIRLDHVTFGYRPDRQVLQDISLRVLPGEQLTVTGRTGAGKSTIFRLLLGLYSPEKGSVMVNGRLASEIPDREKRKIFGYVEQSFYRVPGTILDQITLFDSSVSRDAAVRAAETVGLDPVIRRMEKGYETNCTEGIFSQGQWQLLAVARAIASEPQILLLDEITANLDADTEQMVLSALTRAAKNRTVLSISHRLYEHMGGREFVLETGEGR